MPDDVPAPQVFKYERPPLDRGKIVQRLARSDIMRANMQVLQEGGENNLHAHPNSDGFWLVLSGRVRFYGEGDVLLAELGQHEGILMPRGFKYWFESVGDEPVERGGDPRRPHQLHAVQARHLQRRPRAGRRPRVALTFQPASDSGL